MIFEISALITLISKQTALWPPPVFTSNLAIIIQSACQQLEAYRLWETRSSATAEKQRVSYTRLPGLVS